MTYSLENHNLFNSSDLEEHAPSREGAAADEHIRPDPEVSAKKSRRTFSVQYKLRILSEFDSCTDQGQKGALLRREGLYNSNIKLWRQQKEQGILQGLAQKRGRKSKKNPDQKRIDELEKENARLRERLKKSETIIDVQKKISDILGIAQNQDENGDNSS